MGNAIIYKRLGASGKAGSFIEALTIALGFQADFFGMEHIPAQGNGRMQQLRPEACTSSQRQYTANLKKRPALPGL